MQHEDRVLKSIDLLTANARETLNKYSVWATTKDSDVVFNLYDALPSYDNNGSTGSGIFQKPIRIPSFASISSGIFGTAGTNSSRDIFWNFRFISNGAGWIFDQYVQPNAGQPTVNSTKSPKLDVRTDVNFGLVGSSKNITFNGSNISYSSTNSSISLNDSNYIIETPIFSVSGKSGNGGKYSIFSKDISLGSNIATTVDQKSYSVSNNLFLETKNIVSKIVDSTNGFNYGVFSSTLGSTIIGDIKASIKLLSSSYLTHYLQNSYFNISSIDNASSETINILKIDSESSNGVNALFLHGYDGNFIKNLLIGGSKDTTTLMSRISSLSSEGFQLFVRSTLDNTNDMVSVSSYFDAWIDAGIDASKGIRTTSQYSTLVDGFIDPSFTKTSTNPYYLNIGTKGTFSILGNESVDIFSGNIVRIGTKSSTEILIENGLVTIPNLSIPSYNSISLSSLRKSSHGLYNPQVKIFPFGNLSFNSGSGSASGMEITTDVSNDHTTIAEDSIYSWTTFNYSYPNKYYYNFYLTDDTSTTYKLICDTFNDAGSGTGPNYALAHTTAIVMSGIPKKTLSGSNFPINHIQVVSSEKSVYVVYIEEFIGNVDVPSFIRIGNQTKIKNIIKIYNSDNNGVSFTKKDSEYAVENICYKMDLHAITIDDSECGCGNKDKLWIALEIGALPIDEFPPIYYMDYCQISMNVLCYDEITNSIMSSAISSSQFDTVRDAYYSKYVNIGNSYYADVKNNLHNYLKDSASYLKIVSIYDTDESTYNAYIMMSLTSLNGNYDRYNKHFISICKLQIDTSNNIIKQVYWKDGILDNLVLPNSSLYLPNKLIIARDSANIFKLHTIFTKYDTNTSLGQYSSNVNITLNETTPTPTFTLPTTMAIVSGTSSLDTLSQNRGHISGGDKVLSLYHVNLNNYPSHIYSVDDVSSSLTETLSITINDLYVGNGNKEPIVLPFYSRDVLLQSSSSLLYRYDRSGTSTLDFTNMTIYQTAHTVTVQYSDSYEQYFSSSFVDCFGATTYYNDICATAFSNIKTGKYKYTIGSYNTNTIQGSYQVYTQTINSEVNQLILRDTDTTTMNYFKTVNLNNSNSDTIDGVNIFLKNKDTLQSSIDSKVPVTVLTKCQVSNGDPGVITREGIFNKISSPTAVGIDIGQYGNSGNISPFGKNISYVPVELVSIFAKKCYQGIFTNIIRSDFSITFVNNPSLLNISSSDTSLKYATVKWNDFINSGHSFPWLRYNISEDPIGHSDVYSVYGKRAVIPYNTSFTKEAVLIYDPTYNRTTVLFVANQVTPSTILDINASDMSLYGSGMLISFNNSLINTFDVDFDSTMSLTNSANNVVSLRVDGYSTLQIKNIKTYPTISNLIIGFTETNFVESSC